MTFRICSSRTAACRRPPEPPIPRSPSCRWCCGRPTTSAGRFPPGGSDSATLEGYPRLHAVANLPIVRHAVERARNSAQILNLQAVLVARQIVAVNRQLILPRISKSVRRPRIELEARGVFVNRHLRAVLHLRRTLIPGVRLQDETLRSNFELPRHGGVAREFRRQRQFVPL